MEVRIFHEEDTSAVISLWQACELVVPWNDPARDISRKLQVGRDLFLVGEVGEQLVASVMGGYDGHRGWINYLAVHPEHRRQGLGEVMMEAVEILLRKRGCAKINLQVRRSNHDIIEFYQAIGYASDDVVSLGKRLEQDDPG